MFAKLRGDKSMYKKMERKEDFIRKHRLSDTKIDLKHEKLL